MCVCVCLWSIQCVSVCMCYVRALERVRGHKRGNSTDGERERPLVQPDFVSYVQLTPSRSLARSPLSDVSLRACVKRPAKVETPCSVRKTQPTNGPCVCDRNCWWWFFVCVCVCSCCGHFTRRSQLRCWGPSRRQQCAFTVTPLRQEEQTTNVEHNYYKGGGSYIYTRIWDD